MQGTHMRNISLYLAFYNQATHWKCQILKCRHVSYIVNKANMVLGIIKMSIGNDSQHMFSNLYMSLVRPILKYAAPFYWIHRKGSRECTTVSFKAETRRHELRKPLSGIKFWRNKFILEKQVLSLIFNNFLSLQRILVQKPTTTANIM